MLRGEEKLDEGKGSGTYSPSCLVSRNCSRIRFVRTSVGFKNVRC